MLVMLYEYATRLWACKWGRSVLMSIVQIEQNFAEIKNILLEFV